MEIDGAISGLTPAVYGILILGVGYVILYLKCFFNEKLDYFYRTLTAYDKAIQSLILGTISLAISSFLSQTSYEVLSNIKELVEFSNLYNLLSTEVISVTYIVAALVYADRFLREKNQKESKE